jgi:mono/diheme cytochrome c family protein
MRSAFALPVVLALAAPGCTSDAAEDDVLDPDTPPGSSDPFEGLPTGVEQWVRLCAKGYGDMISQKFCAGGAPPAITSIKELQALLGLSVVPNPNLDPSLNQHVRITLTGHSTGIGLRHVTPLNPRAFLMTPPLATNAPNPRYQVMAFARGEPFVELVANDPQAQTLRFFLMRFHPACEAAPTGCGPADLLTPSIEAGWTGYTLFDDETIEDTTLACLGCHQPGGPGTRKILRMQELANPWAHWFYIEHPKNQAAMMDYHAAHGTEDYAGIPSHLINPSRPISLQRLVTNNGFGQQPNAFDSKAIELEMASGSSPTWSALYARSVAGTEIPAPYHGIPQTDPAKVAPMIQAYQQWRAGALPPEQLPDLRDTLLDGALADMSIRPKAGLDGRGILAHMCQQCHGSRVDPALGRARFNVERLDEVPREVRDEAIRRLRLPDADRRKMPPPRFHTLSSAERDLVIEELSR